jgi:hypothetical protein
MNGRITFIPVLTNSHTLKWVYINQGMLNPTCKSVLISLWTMLTSRRAPNLKRKASELAEMIDLPKTKQQVLQKSEHFRFLDLPPGKYTLT